MIERLARLGYASKAVIYLIVGSLALAAAFNRGGRVTDTSGALRMILTQPFGQAILIVLSVGLCGYAVWRFLDAFLDPDRHGTSARGLVERIGNVVRASVYGALGIEAFRLSRGLRGSTGRETEMWTARIMDWPLGVWIVALVGLMIVAYGLFQIVRALKSRVSGSLDMTSVPSHVRPMLINISRFGIGARGVVIVVLGSFLVRAALEHNPRTAADTRETMLEVANAFDGQWMLLGLGAGLIAYAVDQALHAWCRRIRPVV
jgi:hypothetical protein